MKTFQQMNEEIAKLSGIKIDEATKPNPVKTAKWFAHQIYLLIKEAEVDGCARTSFQSVALNDECPNWPDIDPVWDVFNSTLKRYLPEFKKVLNKLEGDIANKLSKVNVAEEE